MPVLLFMCTFLLFSHIHLFSLSNVNTYTVYIHSHSLTLSFFFSLSLLISHYHFSLSYSLSLSLSLLLTNFLTYSLTHSLFYSHTTKIKTIFRNTRNPSYTAATSCDGSVCIFINECILAVTSHTEHPQ